ncbi:MAG TPA: Glu/Leu/Phe/Val dehydrogenase dimerization domain-containing protein [Bacteroidia bacterium]|jgi:glutamate dehydrogenase/leucine dehydrogenase
MKELLKKYEEKQPEIVFEWKDHETEAEGWIVINSLRGGAAGGGTRMRKGLDKHEVESLAKTMEIKFTVSGPAIGGAKSGINFDPADPRKKEVLMRWFRAVTPILKNYYGTGGDLNIDELHDVIPVTAEYGLLHPQEGVVNGHLQIGKDEKIERIGHLRFGVSKVLDDKNFTPDPTRKYAVADMITGYGVAESVRHFYALHGKNVKGKKVIVQGWGNVAAAAGYYLAKEGAKIIAIIDRAGGVISEKGFSFEEVCLLFLTRKGNALDAKGMIPFEEINKKVWDLKADIFIPAAASRLVTREQTEALINAGLELIASGANVPFADKEIFYGPIAAYADSKISVIPDFIANCGMARVFAYLMGSKDPDLSDAGIFNDTSGTIYEALKKINERNPGQTHITKTAYEIALAQLL